MSNLYDENDGIYEVLCGSSISPTIHESINLAERNRKRVSFKFNEVLVHVNADSIAELIYRDWNRAMSNFIPKEVGPYPTVTLSDKELASDARVDAENQARWAAQAAVWKDEADAKKQRVEAMLVGAADIELIDKRGWKLCIKNNQEPYGAAVVSYARRWAQLMQIELAEGKTLEDVFEETGDDADLEGITGFQHGAAVSILSHVWSHGEELSRLYNLEIHRDSPKGFAAAIVAAWYSILNKAKQFFAKFS